MKSPNWHDVAALIEKNVPKGRVARYGDVSHYFYGHRATQGIGTMLGAWLNHDPANALTHRVVGEKGSMRTVKGLANQRKLLEKEGVPFDGEGRVDLVKCKPVILGE